ncbi:MAG: selenate reductase [Tissierellia bacterium]|nr:selenate reductase [Tissierellia bacterium]
MSDLMYPVNFKQMIIHVLEEYENYQTIYNVKNIFKKSNENVLSIFGEKLENPLGIAAGPHTQLAHNILANYAGGARYMELKTVQALYGEELGIPRPCIRAEDEAYNTEWSSEFKATDARDEYVKAWFGCKVLAKEFEFGDPDGFIFNMSCGYNLEGIKQPLVDEFIDTLMDASDTKVFEQCKQDLYELLPRFKNIDRDYIDSISPNVCRSITLSTMHGCPPKEIEAIGKYLLEEKSINTYIKCNPTLLGYDYVRETFDKMGYDYLTFGHEQFEHDLQMEDAVPMLTRLQELAKELDLEFGVKLTNTFQCKIKNNELPGEDMYMSGKALYPLATAVAYKLSAAFDGKLPISYCGGADRNNIKALYESGMWPITICTILLQPTGLDNIKKLAEILEDCEFSNNKTTDTEKLKAIATGATEDKHYVKSSAKRKKYDLHKSYENWERDDDYYCRVLCKSCVRVCPNRTNDVIKLSEDSIILHIDDICNECGNCQFYCVEPCLPYRDRITLFSSKEDLDNSTNNGFFKKEDQSFYYRYQGKVGEGELPEPLQEVYQAIKEQKPYYFMTK